MRKLLNLVIYRTTFKIDVRFFEAKIRVLEFDYQKKNMLVLIQCSKNDIRVRLMLD